MQIHILHTQHGATWGGTCTDLSVLLLWPAQRALEASRQDAEKTERRRKQDTQRKDRKRKREELRSESDGDKEEQLVSKFDNMQKNIEKVIEKVDAAKNLSETKLRAMLVCGLNATGGDRDVSAVF